MASSEVAVNSSKGTASASQDIRTKTGGAYLPPAKLRMLQQNISDKNSEAYQRLAWEGMKKSINGLINKVNTTNISIMVKELFDINLVRGRGLFVRSLMRAQMSSPTFTHVYAGLVAVCNTKFPKVGELLVKRLIIQFRRSYQRNDKNNCINTVRFIAHLVNQSMVYELLALEILILLLDNATNDSVEVAIAFLKECGAKLDDVARKATAAIFETLRNILHDAELEKRVQYMIEVMFAVRKDKFKDHPTVLPELDLVEEADQFTHPLELSEDYDSEDKLNVFQFDPNFQENEAKYASIRQEIIDDGSSGEGSGSGSDSDDENSDDDDSDGGVDPGPTGTTDSNVIIDTTETNMIALRKTIYLTIQSSLDFEECAHKLLRLEVKDEHIHELCNMIVDCCAQQRTYIKFYGLLAQRFCHLNMAYIEPFKDIFKNCYDTIHRFETGKLRNVGKLFAHLLHADAIPWTVLGHIKLNEVDTTSSSRVFIKILFQQLAESLGLVRLNGRIKDPTLAEAFEGLFPRDDPQNTRFAINFFTSIGLGGLTDDLREHLKSIPSRQQTLGLESLANAAVKKEEPTSSDDSSSSSSDSSSDSDSSDSDSSDSSSEDSDDEESSDDDSDDSSSKRRARKSSSSRKHRKSSPSDDRKDGRRAQNENEDRKDRRSSHRHRHGDEAEAQRDSRKPSRDHRHRDREEERKEKPSTSSSSKHHREERRSRKDRSEEKKESGRSGHREERRERRQDDDGDRRERKNRRDRSSSPDEPVSERGRHLKERNRNEAVDKSGDLPRRFRADSDQEEKTPKRTVKSRVHGSPIERRPRGEGERRSRSVSPSDRDSKRRRH